MTLLQTIIELTFTSIVLVIAGLALAAYTITFYAVMIALEGCEICKWVHNRRTQPPLDRQSQGHSLSRTKRALTQPLVARSLL